MKHKALRRKAGKQSRRVRQLWDLPSTWLPYEPPPPDDPEWYWRRAWVLPNDWAWVTDQLATGGMPTTHRELDLLVEAGITVVINVADELSVYAAELIGGDPRVAYVANPAPDDGQLKTAEWFGVTVGAAVAAIGQGRKVLVHCLSGSNRGPSSAAAVLVALGASRSHAEALVRDARPRARLRYLGDAMEALGAG